MRVLRVDERSPYGQLIGVGGIGTGIFFALQGSQTLGRNESRPGRLLDVRDYCKLHIVIHYVARLLGAQASGAPFHIVPVGRVGDDPAGRQVVKEMSEAGIDTVRVQATTEHPTLFSVCFQYPDGAGGNITTSNSAAATLCEADINEVAGLLKSGGRRGIALSVPEIALEVRRDFLRLATQAGAFRAASFVPAEIGPAKQTGMFGMLDLVSLNEEEAGELVGCPSLSDPPEEFVEKCQQFLRSSFPELRLVVSVGKGGAYGVTTDLWNHLSGAEGGGCFNCRGRRLTARWNHCRSCRRHPFPATERTAATVTVQSINTALELGVLLAS